jgi:TolA-binding protein
MPRETQFRAGSVIYFQGDEADTIFLLKKGGVDLVYQNIESGEDQRDAVVLGEFFGESSALGRYRREENAAASLDSTVMIFTVNEFERLAMSNARIMMKMLRVFSNQLRRVHKKVADLTESGAESPEDGLFHIGEYYLKNRRFSHARHVFSRYLTYYPVGKYTAQAAKCLEGAEALANKYDGGAPAGGAGAAAPKSAAVRPGAPREQAAPQEPAAASSPSAAAAPDAAAASGAASPGAAVDNAKPYYDALSLISQKKYQDAYGAFKKIIEAAADEEYTEKSYFDMGRCLFFMEKYEDCIKFFTQMLMKYPQHPSMAEVLFFIGQSHEKQERSAQAVSFYKKALALASNEEGGIRNQVKKALKSLEH